jgi:hypothetical protein
MKRTSVAVTILVAMIVAISSFAFVRPAQEKDADRIARLQMMAPVNISNTPHDSGYPLVGVDSGGAAYVIWWEFSNPEVLFTTNKSGPWISPQRAAVIRIQRDEAEYYKGFSVAPNGECHLTYLDADVNITNYEVWHAFYNGNSWQSPNNISQTSDSSQASKCAVNPTNNAMTAVWMDETYRLWDILSRSRQSSGNWTSVQMCPIGGIASSPSITIDANGRGHLAWANRTGGTCEVWYARNNNPLDANGWTTQIKIASNTGSVWWTFPEIDCDNAGNAYVCWQDSRPGNDEIFVRKVNSNGTLASEVNVSQSGASSTDPDIAVNKNSGHIYVAWAESGEIFGNAFQGSGWTGPTNITNTAAESGRPAIAADNGGNVHLVYHEKSGSNYEIFYQTSFGGGGGSTTTSTSSTTTVGSSTTTTAGSSTTTSTRTTTIASTSTTTSIPPRPSPPLDPVLDTQLDSSEAQKLNLLAWQRNPNNQYIELESYRVYRKRANMPDSDFIRIGSVSPNTFGYTDSGLPMDQKFAYWVTAMPRNTSAQESDGSELVTEAAAFPPLGVGCLTVINSSLFRREKINVISWRNNPLNNAVAVFQYNIYRKKSDQEETQFQKIASVGGALLEYQDRRLSFSESYDYVVTAVEAGGGESRISGVAREGS